jgi:hypothetical protein
MLIDEINIKTKLLFNNNTSIQMCALLGSFPNEKEWKKQNIDARNKKI